jgi:uncharacterized protein YjbJ (UPF0337 family)
MMITMNQQTIGGQWRQMRGSLKSWWGQFTDDDFERIGGEKDKLVGWVQEKYGRTRDQAEREVDARLNEYSQKAQGGITDFKAKVSEIGETIANKASEATSAVRSGAARASSYLEEKKIDEMTADVTSLVRKYPIQSMLIGIALGVWLARSSKH